MRVFCCKNTETEEIYKRLGCVEIDAVPYFVTVYNKENIDGYGILTRRAVIRTLKPFKLEDYDLYNLSFIDTKNDIYAFSPATLIVDAGNCQFLCDIGNINPKDEDWANIKIKLFGAKKGILK